MMKQDKKIEKNLLKFSIFAAFGFALLGFIWGFAIDSQMLIFDGIYSFISVILSGISLYVANVIKKEEDEKFQFGRSQLEPIAILFKSLTIFSVCVYAFIGGLQDIYSGGTKTNIESAILYSVIATISCIACWWIISYQSKKVKHSGLLLVEKHQWLMDTLLSSAVLVGFTIAYFLEKTEYNYLVKYIDPFMVVLVTGYFFKMPLMALKGSIQDLLLMAPGQDDEVYDSIETVLPVLMRKYGFDDYDYRLAKTGRIFDIKVSFISDNPDLKLSLRELDIIRQDTEKKLNSVLNRDMWLDVSFMNDKKWA